MHFKHRHLMLKTFLLWVDNLLHCSYLIKYGKLSTVPLKYFKC